MKTANHQSISDAAQAAGINPGVLRVWEDRYGWPLPKRNLNGHRSFTAREVEQLKRIVELIKAGTPIGALIIDGVPQLPTDHLKKPTLPRQKILSARTLPGADGPVMGTLREDLCQAFDERHPGHVLETIQRARLDLRPLDELRVVLLPVLVAVAELRQQRRALADEQNLFATVSERCAQLERRFSTHGNPLSLHAAASPADTALAQAVAALLAARGIPTRFAAEAADAPVLVAMSPPPETSGNHSVVLTPLPYAGCIPVTELLDDDHPCAALAQLAIPALSLR